MFFGDGERIEVRHQAHSRQAFVGGAVRVAHWVMEQGAGVSRVYGVGYAETWYIVRGIPVTAE